MVQPYGFSGRLNDSYHEKGVPIMAISGNGEDQKDWARIQVYVPPDFYEVLQSRAKHRGVSLSAEGLRLMRLGLANVKPSENIAADLTALQRYLELHLEPLTFIAAMDAAVAREYWKNLTFRSATAERYPDPQKTTDEGGRNMGERATNRIQRKLRGLGDGDDDENNGA